ncbi:MAG: hypothetical protein AABW63_03200 [Nanoarchaeota archaeon]
MKKIDVFKVMALLFFMAILFTPQHSFAWLYFAIPGLIFGFLWFKKLD